MCGARQVEKTWSIDQFGQAEFRNVATIDFEKRPTLKPLFTGDLSPAVLVEQLELATGQRIRPGEALLFLDEIQACPRAVTALRYFHEELPSLRVVAAGSLLDFALAEVSVPVGRVSSLEMHPLTFREYLQAIPVASSTSDLAGHAVLRAGRVLSWPSRARAGVSVRLARAAEWLETAAHLVDRVIPPVPMRQWVISVPKRLRCFLADRPSAVAALTRIFISSVERLLRTAAGSTRDGHRPSATRPRLGAVSFLHRFGSALNHHVHLRA